MSENKNFFRYENGKIVVGGVINVESFEEKSVSLRLADSVLVIGGNGFKLEELEVKSGVFGMEGEIKTLTYHSKGEKVSFIKKLLK